MALATMVLFDGTLFADYHQIYLCDATLPPLPDGYDDDAMADRVMVAPQALILHTERNMDVPLRVLLHAARPDIEPDGFDHVAECGLAAPSGQLVVAGMTDDVGTAARLAVPPGPLRALLTFEGLGTLSEDGLDGEDRYAIHLWPGEGDPGPAVLRRWSAG